MLKNHFLIVLRRLLKDRKFTFLNLIGLSVGLACTLLIFLWVADELSFDKFHEKDSRLYQVLVQQQSAEGIGTASVTPALLADALAREMPEVEYASSFQVSFSGIKYTLSLDNKHIKAVGVFAGKDYLNIFSWKLVEGNKEQALADKSSLVLTESLAKKLFGTTENVIGKTVEWAHDKVFKVAGLIKDIPANSSIRFDFILPFDVFLDAYPHARDWGSSDPYTYLVLKPGTSIDQFNEKIKNFIRNKIPNSKSTLLARKFSRGYLHGKYENGVEAGGRIEYVRLFSIIALFILVIACINFMNLSTAKASRRLREVGIKKVVGATRSTLILQFMIESVLMTVLALIIALFLVWVLIYPFSDITGKQLSFHFDIYILLIIVGITLFTGLVAGSYPAFYLSGFNPVTVLKGELRGSVGELWVRRGLVIFQFTLSALFIVAVLVVYRQIAFVQSRNPGFNKDNVLTFDMEGMTTGNNMEAFLSGVNSFVHEVRNIPGVVNASSMDHGSIINDFGSTSDIMWEGKRPDENINFANIGVNYGMIETLGMQIIAGRSFSRDLSADSSEIIFNETAIEKMGVKDPIGMVVKFWGRDRRIVGIVKNFHFQSLHESVQPIALRLEPKLTYRIVVKIRAGKENETIASVGRLFSKYNPGYAFDYRFLDQDYEAQYVAEKRVAILSRYFSGLAILISCLGLFGLAAFTAQRKQKEISIRKVIGASSGNIALLLSKDFLNLVLISIIIAFPLAWWIMNQWLNNFVYRINISPDIFLLAGLSIILITIVTISFQSVKAAVANPLKGLQLE